MARDQQVSHSDTHRVQLTKRESDKIHPAFKLGKDIIRYQKRCINVVADLGFSRQRRETHAIYYLAIFFSENCLKNERNWIERHPP